ncbi:MAG: CHAD domain-containing protein [Bacteroidales bacterium]|jgi:CHAD domain-containing protein|nr:CHAD domain-containing protein [Bacteroidales bacterium]NLD63000.1 CHAD domain-containing protein [Bacteroidales bacterium]HNT93683.1 CHAD domain-containing protein [Bacteroidales bacterium]HPE23578.1 CHAD domain-containing protein [Bacteroidales bacterium]HRW28100.1 CHAD domain-containing protein [Bacteroidales bacterium]
MAPNKSAEAKDIKAAMAGYLAGSLKLLDVRPVPGDAAIHDVRVLMKKHRAAVRLIRPLLDEAVYSREYLAGRETGRILATWREMAVLRKTARALKKENPELFVRLRDNEKMQGLLRKPYSTWDEAGEKAGAVREVAGRLKKAEYRLRFLGLNEPDMLLMLGELDGSYKTACQAYMACRHKPSARLLHEFRKKSKTLMYQLTFFRHLNPAAVKPVEKKLNAMTRNLGKYNDLDQIIQLTGYRFGAPENSDTDNELAIVIRDRQERYLMKVWPAAYRIFAPGKKLQDILGITF